MYELHACLFVRRSNAHPSRDEASALAKFVEKKNFDQKDKTQPPTPTSCLLVSAIAAAPLPVVAREIFF